jgi:uncharacterized protein with PIN domain
MDELIDMLRDQYPPSEIIEKIKAAIYSGSRGRQILDEFALDNNLCPKCNENLETHTWREPRGEHFGYPAEEYVSQLWCNNCNRGY